MNRHEKESLQWSKLNYGPMTWADAVKFCENLEEDGKTDWRLPTIQELFYIINYSKANPASDLDLKPSYYWSSTTHASHPNDAWIVAFYYGYVYNDNKSNSYYVRAVRNV